jgi:hypothetical protein
MAEFKDWFEVSTIEKSGIDYVRIDLGKESVGERQAGQEGGEDGDTNTENEEN